MGAFQCHPASVAGALLAAAANRSTTGELAKRLGITVSTTSGLVIKLVDRGLVARGSLADDRRQAPLRLTDEGSGLLGELSDEGRAFLANVADRLGDDLEAVTLALNGWPRPARSTARPLRRPASQQPASRPYQLQRLRPTMHRPWRATTRQGEGHPFDQHRKCSLIERAQPHTCERDTPQRDTP